MSRFLQNTVLLAVVVFLGWKTAALLKSPEVDLMPPQKTRVVNQSTDRRWLPVPPSLRPKSAFDVIVQNNLFSPDRAAPAEPESPEPAPAKTPAPSIRGVHLWGVVQSGGRRLALLETSDGKYSWISEDDDFNRFTVSEIRLDAVVLRDPNRTTNQYTVKLYDPEKPRSPKRAEKASAPSTASESAPELVVVGQEKPKTEKPSSKPRKERSDDLNSDVRSEPTPKTADASENTPKPAAKPDTKNESSPPQNSGPPFARIPKGKSGASAAVPNIFGN